MNIVMEQEPINSKSAKTKGTGREKELELELQRVCEEQKSAREEGIGSAFYFTLPLY